MDILSKHKVGSDLPLMEKQRKPIYKGKEKNISPKMGQIDNMSEYVEQNLKDTVKPRGGEHR
jgi:hypothetical protein